MGCPKQEKWIYNYLSYLNIKIAVLVGGVFEVIAGTKKRAPRWMQKIGLEWFWRLIQEPRRLWKRYLIGNTIFIFLVIEELIKKIFNKFKPQLGQNSKKCL
jgi:N-acetylglucosaminyldiphosphoundecaprenol N-acetyl-beta-D-mannosaminyltransferase